MDGDIVDVAELAALCARYDAGLILDEAHATAVHGPDGRGIAAAAGTSWLKSIAITHTCGKALASAGAFVCGSAALREHLINHARTFIFSTAMPPYMAGQIRAALRIARGMNSERAALLANAERLAQELRSQGYDTGGVRIANHSDHHRRERRSCRRGRISAKRRFRGARDPPADGCGWPRAIATLADERDFDNRIGSSGKLPVGMASPARTAGGGVFVRNHFFITGTDTGVGKTTLSALLCAALDAVYWKPIQTGTLEGSDRVTVMRLAGIGTDRTLDEVYKFVPPVSPDLGGALGGD